MCRRLTCIVGWGLLSACAKVAYRPAAVTEEVLLCGRSVCARGRDAVHTRSACVVECLLVLEDDYGAICTGGRTDARLTLRWVLHIGAGLWVHVVG